MRNGSLLHHAVMVCLVIFYCLILNFAKWLVCAGSTEHVFCDDLMESSWIGHENKSMKQ